MSTICDNCKGSGVDPLAGAVKPGEESVPCPICGGNGKAVEQTEE